MERFALRSTPVVRIEALSIPSVKVLAPEKHGDHRGFFSEVYSRRALAEAGLADIDNPFSCRPDATHPTHEVSGA